MTCPIQIKTFVKFNCSVSLSLPSTYSTNKVTVTISYNSSTIPNSILNLTGSDTIQFTASFSASNIYRIVATENVFNTTSARVISVIQGK